MNFPLLEKNSSFDKTSTLFLSGDLDGSGQVNSLDWIIYIERFNSDDELADMDGSGKVTALDNTFILINWYAEDEK
jgi:hypothetical protein